MRRRNVLKAGLGTAVWLAAPVSRANLMDFEYGLQLSTLTPLLLKDFEATLARVAEIGYRQVEFSAMGFLGQPVDVIARLLEKYGLSAPVARVSPPLPRNFRNMDRTDATRAFRARAGMDHFLDNVRHCVGDAGVLGQKYLNLPAMTPDRFKTLDQVRENIELISEAGEICAEAGIQFGYHNHNWELLPIDEVIPYDLMLAETDAEKVGFQLDTYWIVKGGGNLERYLTDYPGRFATCHLKDIDDNGDFADVGSGNINFPEFIRLALSAGTRYFFVERDGPPDPIASVTNSHVYLSGLR